MRRVVVTGMGVVSPIGIGRDRFFDGLRNGTSGIDTIKSFDATSFATRIAGEVKGFCLDASIDCGPHAAAVKRDRKSAFAILAGVEAIRDSFAATRPSELYRPERIGVMAAAGLEIFHPMDIAPYMRNRRIDGAALTAALMQNDEDAFLQIPADLGGRVLRNLVGAKGISAVNVSACAAGTQALGEAFRALREDKLDAVIAGGYDSMVNPVALGGFCRLEALSTRNDDPKTASRPFDISRDGFVLGEGAAFFVLEEREKAERRGAKIVVEILGYASTLDAFRVTDPSEDHVGAAAAMQRALEDARLELKQIDYINAHGTGTLKNDPAEAAAIRRVFGKEAERIKVSSTKSQIGHLIGAAGAVEFMAGIFAVENQLIPATITLCDPDPSCALNHAALTPRPARVDRFISNSFGFGGQNAVIVAGRLG
jgi:3-oxoacyl-[acyl-carrier-protein] synthase II